VERDDTRSAIVLPRSMTMTRKRFVRGSLLRLRNSHSSVNSSKNSRYSESSLPRAPGVSVCFLVVPGKSQSNQSGAVLRLGSIGSTCGAVRCGEEIWPGSGQTTCLHGNCSSLNPAAYIGPQPQSEIRRICFSPSRRLNFRKVSSPRRC
jgi:hypothetical protein